jgi:PII-like signaling protein
MRPGKLVEIHCGEKVYEAIVQRCRELGIAGATVLRGVEGYGETAAIERKPVTVVVVDDAERIAALLAAVEGMLDGGLITISDVSIRRVQATSPAE